MSTFSFGFFATTLICFVNGAYPPEQIHIAFYGTPDQMSFTWLTWDSPIKTDTIVKIGLQPFTSELNINATGNSYLFTDCGSEHVQRTIHMVNISSLLPSTTYYYQVGDPYYGWSSIYSFTTLPDATTLQKHLPMKYLIYGDLGDANAETLTSITECSLSSPMNVDMIIHVGDFAYNFYEENGTRGDDFMLDITAVAASIPYMTCPGNHESAYNFSHYSQRFRGQPPNLEYAYVWTQSGKTPNNWFFSWNSGLTHYIAIDTEIYFDFPAMISDQWYWVKNDLEIANKNRTEAPWIIVFGHKPLYCSENGDCSSAAELVRWGPKQKNGSYIYGMENLFYEFGVDFYFCGHEHNYERMYDIYENKTTQTTINMPSTTYIVSGSAGNREDHDPFTKDQPIWSAYRTQAYSYTKWDVYNSTHIHLQQYVADSTLPQKDQGVCDDVWYVQHKHGPFSDNYGEIQSSVNAKDKSISWDAYPDKKTMYGYDMKKENKIRYKIPYISDNEQDYKDAKRVYF